MSNEKHYSDRFPGLGVGYKVLNILIGINTVIVLFLGVIMSMNMGDAAIIGILLTIFLAFIVWLITTIYRDLLLLVVKVGKDLNDIKQILDK